MRRWPVALGMIGAPSLALGTQSLMYALVLPACSMQREWTIHAVAAASLLLAIGSALLARREWRARGDVDWHAAEQDALSSGHLFTAAIATAVALISALAIAAMWLGAVFLSACWR